MHGDHRTETKSNECQCLPLEEVRFEEEYGQQTSTESSLIIGENELLLSGGEDVDDIKELLDAGLLFTVEHTFVEEVKTVAGSPFECIDFSMLEESGHILPRFPIILQLLEESTHANDNMFTLKFRTANPVQLKHVAPFNWGLNL